MHADGGAPRADVPKPEQPKLDAALVCIPPVCTPWISAAPPTQHREQRLAAAQSAIKPVQPPVAPDAPPIPNRAQFQTYPAGVFAVERLLKVRTQRGKKQYLVLWEGYPEAEATWEPAAALSDVLINAFIDGNSRLAA